MLKCHAYQSAGIGSGRILCGRIHSLTSLVGDQSVDFKVCETASASVTRFACVVLTFRVFSLEIWLGACPSATALF